MEDMYNIRQGDCREVMREMPEKSVDAIVTDPPYGLSFMGKEWDHGVPGVQFWTEAIRVAKPGAHLLAFGGTRTFHRLTCAIEDAGWEIRDCVMWVYGSGFPKSLDVSKAIDRRGGKIADFSAFRDDLRRAMEVHSITRKELEDRLGNRMLSHYLTKGVQPAIPNVRDYKVLRDALQLGDRWDELFLDEAEREVVGTAVAGIVPDPSRGERHTVGGHSREYVLTAPATSEARAWDGWGTALKPAWEPVIVARKPLEGTVAENVLRHGTGAINVDGCRVGTDNTRRNSNAGTNGDGWGMGKAANINGSDAGRWPANVIHDGSDEVVGLFPVQVKDGKDASAARFFYCAKASKADRDEGCEGLEAIHRANGNKWTDQDYRVTNGERPPSAESGPRRNHHPTVKPTDLMRYLCRLVTPPGGVVLDPFMGSGSTGKAAILEGFRFIGVDLNPEYIEIARARIAQSAQQSTTLF